MTIKQTSNRVTWPIAASLALLTCFLPASLVQAADKDATPNGVAYGIQLTEAGDAYQVVGVPSNTPDGNISLSGQVTLKVPHSDDPKKRFNLTNLTNEVKGVEWIESSRVDAPTESPDSDYISLSFIVPSGTPNLFPWQAEQALPLFSFNNAGECLGDIDLMEDADPFNQMPNSVTSNPGNQFTNLGWGNINTNHYLGNVGKAAPCPKVNKS